MCGQRPRGIEQKWLALLGARPEDVVVDAQMDHPDPLGSQPEQGDRPVADELADHDHPVGATHRAVPGDGPESALLPREEGRQVEVLQVEERGRRRLRDGGDPQRQRVVHDGRIAEAAAERPGPCSRERHRRQPARDRARLEVFGGDL